MKSLSLYFLMVAALLLATIALAADHGPNLEELIAATPKGEPVPLVLFLDHRLTMDDVYPVAVSLPMDARRDYVVKTLEARFAEMGSRVMEYLESEKKAGRVIILRPLWILNGVRVTAMPEVIAQLDAAYPEATYIVGDPVHPNTLDTGWGVTDMQAPRVWSNLGADGSGVIVAHKDAGLDVGHPGFAGHLWINPGEDIGHDGAITAADSNGIDDDGDGYVDDFWGWGFDRDNNDVRDNPDAQGNYGHGTKTASIISAGFSPCDTVSVAPGAKIMELSAFLTQGAFWEASQYAIMMGATLISSSVSFKESDCNSPRDTQWPGVLDCPNRVAHRMVCEMELAAGLIHANSTGNQQRHTEPASLGAPADCPPPVMTATHPIHGGVSSIVGVNAYNSSGNFQNGGYGPSAWTREDLCINPRMAFCSPPGHGPEFPYNDYPYHSGAQSGLIKPDIIAPTNVNSLAMRSQSSCGSVGGTSGATPHVGGALALIFSKFPGITPEAAYLLLVNTARDGGAAGFDNMFGFGKVSPFPACSSGVAMMTLLTGTVSGPNGPVADVRISADGTNSVESGPSGNFNLWLNPGTHTVRFEKFPFNDSLITVTATGGTLSRNVTLHQGELQGTISVTWNGVPGSGGTVVTIPKSGAEVTTNELDEASFPASTGRYEIIVHLSPIWLGDTLVANISQGATHFVLNLVHSPVWQPTGPESGGYWLYDNLDVPQAAYHWVEINPNAGGLAGTQLATGGDGVVLETLPFTFRYYGTDYTQISVSANGFIVFDSYTANPDSDYCPQPIPAPQTPNGFLAPWWADWEPQREGSKVLSYSDADNHRIIVEWYNVQTWDSVGRATFEAVLYDPQYVTSPTGDGVVRYQYRMASGHVQSSSVGFENAAGTDGLQCAFQGYYETHVAPIDAGRAFLITTESYLAADPANTAVLPQQFVLHSNYPNPFNPTTTFSWSMPRSANVRLAMYDVLGREAAVVFEGMCIAGEHVQPFDGSHLSTGVYFVRLESQGKSQAVRKVLLLK